MTDRTAFALASVATIAAFLTLSPFVACSYLEPACAVIDVAHQTCEYVTIEYIDDEGKTVRENVPRSELRSLAAKHTMQRQVDGGAQ